MKVKKSFSEPPLKNTEIRLFVRRQKNVLEEHSCSCRKNNFIYVGTVGFNENSEHVLDCKNCKSLLSNKPRQTRFPEYLNIIFFWEPITQN